MTHFAVETVLGARGPLPPEAGEVECIVGLFDMDRASGVLLTAADWDTFAPPLVRRLSDAQIACVRSRRGELFSQWAAVAPGQALELRFAASR